MTTEYQPLPSELVAALPREHVEYEAFVVALVPPESAGELVDRAWQAGIRSRTEDDSILRGPAFEIDLRDPDSRRGPWQGMALASVPVAGLHWVQFGYPIRRDWVYALEDCGALVVEWLRERTLLVDAPSRERILECAPIAPFVALVDDVLSTDRSRPEALAFDGLVLEVIASRATLEDVFADLPDAQLVEVIEGSTNPHVTTYVLSGTGATEALLQSSYLYSAVAEPERLEPSDERQALVLARKWNPINGNPYHALSYVNNFLQPRGLNNATNLPAIAVMDSGIDLSPHPEIAGALLGGINCIDLVGSPAQCQVGVALEDDSGHGTLVASTALGRGVAGGDDGKYRRGQGTSPYSALWVGKIRDYNASCVSTVVASAPLREQAFEYVRWNAATGADRALVANVSQNASTDPVPTTYGASSWGHDKLVLDAARLDPPDSPSDLQPMTIVVSSGNGDAGEPCQVSDPALGKNVIAVGSVDQVENWEEDPADTCPLILGPTPDPMNGPHVVSEFSCPGAPFGTSPQQGLHQVRVKPDVVAPGWRVDGARPDPLPCEDAICDPVDLAPTYSYGRGTSFSAPAVAGVAALTIKDLRDSGVTDPKPSLVKAALIATASSLTPGGGACTDCRPSPAYGWGLVDLDRLTGDMPRWVVNETASFTAVGQAWTSPILHAAQKAPVLIALVWSDAVTTASPTLRRDLDLSVVAGSVAFVGNNFNENLGGPDNGWSYGFGWPFGMVDDDVNTVEAVFLSQTDVNYHGLLTGGFQVSVGIETFTDAGSAFVSQPFSLFVWNATCSGC